MHQRGRKSAELLSLGVIDTQRLRLKAPDFLNEREAEIFRSIVDSCAPDHFRKSELPLLGSYCTAVNLSRWHAHELNEGHQDHHRQWLECTKLVDLLASRLRLAPSTLLDKGRVEREVTGDVPRPWDRQIPTTEED
jgi:phage terminase small subunit